MKVIIPYTNTLIGYINKDEFPYLEKNFTSARSSNEVEIQFKHLCNVKSRTKGATIEYYFEIPFHEKIPDNPKKDAIFFYGTITNWSTRNVIKVPAMKLVDLLFKFFIAKVYSNYRQENIGVVAAFQHYIQYLGLGKYGIEFSTEKNMTFPWKIWNILGARYYKLPNTPLLKAHRENTSCIICFSKFGLPNLKKHKCFICHECYPKLKSTCPLCRGNLINC